jgi:integrase/recombinase XerC
MSNMKPPVPESLLPLFLPAPLDGRNGLNRARDTNRQIDAETDIEAIRFWLAEYTLSPHTLRNYRKEAIRLIVWSTRALGKPLSSLTREDFRLYEQFLIAPNVDWTNPAPSRRSGARRLFDSPLSPHSRQQSLNILSSMLNYLVFAGYLAVNPLALGTGRAGTSLRGRRAKHNINYSLWQFVLESIESWPQATVRERQRYERSRWAMRLLYHTALRVSEVANAKSCDFRQRRGRWWLHVKDKSKGKGELGGEIQISETLMSEFARYRTFHGLSPIPLAYDTAPALMSISGDTARHLTSAAVYLIARDVFRRAATMLELDDPIGAKALARATTHWLRQSAILHQSSSAINPDPVRGAQMARTSRSAVREGKTSTVALTQDDEPRSASA